MEVIIGIGIWVTIMLVYIGIGTAIAMWQDNEDLVIVIIWPFVVLMFLLSIIVGWYESFFNLFKRKKDGR